MARRTTGAFSPATHLTALFEKSKGHTTCARQPREQFSFLIRENVGDPLSLVENAAFSYFDLWPYVCQCPGYRMAFVSEDALHLGAFYAT